MREWLGFLATCVVALGLAILGTTPPGPRQATAPAPSFSAERAMVDVRRIGASPHSTGTAENAAVRAYLVQRLKSLDMEVREDGGPLDAMSAKRLAGWSQATGPAPRLTNIIARLPGRDPSLPALALMAHHDTVWGSPGAADDTVGVASILETIRALKAKGQPARDVYAVFTDAEELGLNGARRFFDTAPEAGRIGAIVNLEARGGGGTANMFQLSPGNGPAARLYAGVVERPVTSSLSAFLYSILPNDTDLTVALKHGGYTAYNIAFIGRSSLYHSPLATPERLDQGGLQHMGQQTLALAQALSGPDTLPTQTQDATFFDVFSMFTIVYPLWVGWLMLAVAAVCLTYAWTGGTRSGSADKGVARMLGFVIVAGLVSWLANRLSGVSSNYYVGLAAIPRLIWIGVFAVGASWLLFFGKSLQGLRSRIGTVLPIALLALVAQILAPPAAYFVVLPLTLVALGEAIRVRTGSSWASLVAAIPVTGYMLVLGFGFMEGVGPSMPWIVALPSAVAAVSLLPLWPGLAPKMARSGALVLIAAALLFGLWIRLDGVPPTVAVYAANKPG